MITLDLRYHSMTVSELLQAARAESVLIVSDDGVEFILEPADAFEQEVAALRQSQPFKDFLAERRRETGRIPFEAITHRLKPLPPEGESD